MEQFISFLIGFIVALLSNNDKIRFYVEKTIRKIFNCHLVSIELVSEITHCKDSGMLLFHCIRINNIMWFTDDIQNTYLLSHGQFSGDARAFKPLIFFQSTGMHFSIDYTSKELFEKLSKKITLYNPDNSVSGINLIKNYPMDIVILCEHIDKNLKKSINYLNECHLLGDLYVAFDNPMPKVKPGAKFNISIVSQKYGHVDWLDIEIPSNLAEIEPLGNSSAIALKINNRHACLCDLDILLPTWPLRFNIKKYKILIKNRKPEVSLNNPEIQKEIKRCELKSLTFFQKDERPHRGGILIQGKKNYIKNTLNALKKIKEIFHIYWK